MINTGLFKIPQKRNKLHKHDTAMFDNPLCSNINMHILHTIWYIFLCLWLGEFVYKCTSRHNFRLVIIAYSVYDMHVIKAVRLWEEVTCSSSIRVKGFGKYMYDCHMWNEFCSSTKMIDSNWSSFSPRRMLTKREIAGHNFIRDENCILPQIITICRQAQFLYFCFLSSYSKVINMKTLFQSDVFSKTLICH